MPKGRLYHLGRHDRDGKAESRDTFGRKLACRLSLCVFAISNRCSKDSCCAHKGLVTNWPHPNMLFEPGLKGEELSRCLRSSAISVAEYWNASTCMVCEMVRTEVRRAGFKEQKTDRNLDCFRVIDMQEGRLSKLAFSALNTPAEKPSLVGLSSRLRPLAGLVGCVAHT
jgi:hypothetical protein